MSIRLVRVPDDDPDLPRPRGKRSVRRTRAARFRRRRKDDWDYDTEARILRGVQEQGASGLALLLAIESAGLAIDWSQLDA